MKVIDREFSVKVRLIFLGGGWVVGLRSKGLRELVSEYVLLGLLNLLAIGLKNLYLVLERGSI